MHVGRLDRPGRFESGTSSIVEGHTGSVLDFDWNPFDCSMFASASEDCSIKIWSIPDDWEPTDNTGRAKQVILRLRNHWWIYWHTRRKLLC